MITIPLYTGVPGIKCYVENGSMTAWDKRLKKPSDQLINVPINCIEDVNEHLMEDDDGTRFGAIYNIKNRTENANELRSESI